MKRHLAIALTVACAAAANAFAGDITVDPNPFVSTASRAQVREELTAFRHGGVGPWADEYNQLAQFRGSMTRADVKAEFLAGRKEAGAFSGEDSGSIYLARNRARTLRPATELAHAE